MKTQKIYFSVGICGLASSGIVWLLGYFAVLSQGVFYAKIAFMCTLWFVFFVPVIAIIAGKLIGLFGRARK